MKLNLNKKKEDSRKEENQQNSFLYHEKSVEVGKE
jgi:hypothetical protein